MDACPHQWCATVGGGEGDIRSVREERLHDGDLPLLRGKVEGGAARRALRVDDLHLVRQQEQDGVMLPKSAGNHEGGDLAGICRLLESGN
eukprot:2134408-Prymnesium_polylepis.1